MYSSHISFLTNAAPSQQNPDQIWVIRLRAELMRQNPPVVCVDITGSRLTLFTPESSSTPSSAYRCPIILNAHQSRVS